MKPSIKKPRKPNILLEELKERRIAQILFCYAVGAFGFLAGVYEITSDDRIRTAALILCITGIPVVAIAAWFHGKGGKNPVTKVEFLLITLCTLIGGGFTVKTLVVPTPITILIRMMDPQERWFQENILKAFEEGNHCKVIIKRFWNEQDVIRILKSEKEGRKKSNVCLVKTPLHLTLLLYKDKFIKPYDDILRDLDLNESEIQSWLQKVKDDYDPVALEMCSFNTITGKKLFFLPRKLETRLIIYRKSKVADAVKDWKRFRKELNAILEKANDYGLPRDYKLESDVNKWDYYDLLVAGYYWANTQYYGEKTARLAHRSKNYGGTVLGLIDRALQLGATGEDIYDMYSFSEAIVDLFHWEAIFRKYNLYCEGMWEGDGLSGSGIYEGIAENRVFLTWMHQLDSLLIFGSEEMGIKGFIQDRKDLGIAIMPKGVSFPLTEDGLPKRTGSRKAHTFGWFWGIPINAPEPELALKLGQFITSHECHLGECKNFFLIPVRKSVRNALNAVLNTDWKAQVYRKSIEQFEINGDRMVPRFKRLDDYEEFIHDYYDAFEEIVIKMRYSSKGHEGRANRNFIRENIR
ncbi:MAG: hypothetical protein PVH02_16450 [Desulfobacteraceae bacterium]|jgi:ABC-type glycerol-3-phosphate transport system substrate-binding protein